MLNSSREIPALDARTIRIKTPRRAHIRDWLRSSRRSTLNRLFYGLRFRAVRPDFTRTGSVRTRNQRREHHKKQRISRDLQVEIGEAMEQHCQATAKSSNAHGPERMGLVSRRLHSPAKEAHNPPHGEAESCQADFGKQLQVVVVGLVPREARVVGDVARNSLSVSAEPRA